MSLLKILLVEDSLVDAELILRELRRGGLDFEVQRVHEEAEYIAALEKKPDLVLSDFALPLFDGLTALSLLKKRYQDVPFILISGAIGEDLAVSAMREGASDYLLKDRLSRLPTAVRGALAQTALSRENRVLEERLLRAARLESLGRLAAGLAHDLNNILMPIMLAEQLLRDEVKSASGLEVLETIEMSASRGALVLKQLLTFGRGTDGERIAFRVEDAIAEVCSVMRETFPKDIEVQTEVDAEALVFADATQMQQILLNLCVNARDAMPAGGTLRISVTSELISSEFAAHHPGAEPGSYVLIAVRDTGNGIDESALERIFDPFFTTKELEHGTGLGLSSVLGIVQSYGGFIQVESERGSGAEFKVWLRAYEGVPSVEATSSVEVRSRGEGRRVLLVDDEEAILEILSASLQRFGYRTLLASDGEAALELLDRRLVEVDAVVADLLMPRVDGIRLVRGIRERSRTLPIVVMTGALSVETRQNFESLGVSEFVLKPFQTEALLSCLTRVLAPIDLSARTLAGA